MILNCPNCIAQFYVDDELLQPSGRKVKCSSCGTTWLQRPVLEDDDSGDGDLVGSQGGDSDSAEVDLDFVRGDDSDEDNGVDTQDDAEIDEALERAIERLEQEVVEDDVSASVEHAEDHDVIPPVSPENQGELKAPANEEAYRPSGFTDALEAEEAKGKKIRGYAAAASVFLVISFGLLFSGSSMMAAYPSTQAVYGWFGMKAEIPGKDLIFQNIEVVTDGNITNVKGKVINFGNEETRVPSIVAVVNDSHEQIVTEYLIDVYDEILPEQGMYSFEANINDVHLSSKDTYSLTLRFAMDYEVKALKTDGGDDGNSQAHHQGENDHQSAHAASEESHQPASSHAHQEPSHPSHDSGH